MKVNFTLKLYFSVALGELLIDSVLKGPIENSEEYMLFIVCAIDFHISTPVLRQDSLNIVCLHLERDPLHYEQKALPIRVETLVPL